LVFGVLCWRYRWRAALVAMLPTVAAIGLTLAYSGYAGTPLTLFNVMALLLVLGVGVNYVIFLHEGAGRRAAVLVGVFLSALTTLLSFGLLGWSSTPALSQFGSTLFVGISVTVALSLLFGSWVDERSA
jgi:predicted exporter